MDFDAHYCVQGTRKVGPMSKCEDCRAYAFSIAFDPLHCYRCGRRRSDCECSLRASREVQ